MSVGRGKARNKPEAAKVQKRLRKKYPQMYEEKDGLLILKKAYAGKKSKHQRTQNARLARWY